MDDVAIGKARKDSIASFLEKRNGVTVPLVANHYQASKSTQKTDTTTLYPGEHWCPKCADAGVKKWGSFGLKTSAGTTWSCSDHKRV